jgi:ankyrin repeat protein
MTPSTQESKIAKFLYGMEESDITAVRSAVAEGVDVNSPLQDSQYEGLTPLMLCAEWGNSDMCRELMALGANPHATVHDHLKITALGNAAYKGQGDACRLLLEKSPPLQHIHGAIALARSGRKTFGKDSRRDDRYRDVLNALLWARDGIGLPGAVIKVVAGEHPEIDRA